jgi:hypothetical protein
VRLPQRLEGDLVGYRAYFHPVRSNNRLDERSSIVAASVGRQVLPATDTETTPSLLWFATMQCIESKQDLSGLAPKDCLIPAQPVERVARQIGKTQKATGEVSDCIKGSRPSPGPSITVAFSFDF